ncbi:MAG: hypothetical protein LC687_07895, partial [Actinobacteria bacterium]|nr:hypothetical protein [Actinomycetota bacterium]
AVKDFPDAADIADLTDKANEYLANAKDPTQDINLTYYYNAVANIDYLTYNGTTLTYDGDDLTLGANDEAIELNRGDTIRVVSKSLGQAFTGRVEELDWSVGSVDIRLGQPAYNLIDVINGPKDDEERRKTTLGLPAPIGVAAYKSSPGITLRVNPYTNSLAVGVEVYIGTTSGFTADRSTLATKSPGTRFEFPNLTSGGIFYLKVRAYDAEGNVSEFADTVSAQSGYVDGGRIGEGTIDITPFASALRPPRNVTTLPTLPDANYLNGDLVVYDDGTVSDPRPRLYENQSGTWVELTAGDLEGKTVAHQIVAGQVVAAAIGAEEIAADAITTGKLRSGNVVIDDTGGTTGESNAVRVYDDSSDEQVRMGYIGNITGVPVDYGFWGKLGTGVFIEDAPRSIGLEEVL